MNYLYSSVAVQVMLQAALITRFVLYIKYFIFIFTELGTCACMKSLERTQQGPFHLRKNVLEERDWTFPKILEALKDNKELNLKDNRKEEVRL